jgi:hypothetical protein
VLNDAVRDDESKSHTPSQVNIGGFRVTGLKHPSYLSAFLFWDADTRIFDGNGQQRFAILLNNFYPDRDLSVSSEFQSVLY